jgi:alginate O-acetyltransferase complex protein AlgJ
MQLLLRSARYALPVVFFGYAAIFNLEYARFPSPGDVALDATALRGALTAQLDSVYRESLPHRDSAIGAMGALRYLAVGEGRKGVVAGKDGWLFTDEEIRPLTDDLDLSLTRIARIRDRLQAAGADLVIVPVPGKLDVQVAHADAETAKGIATLYDAFLTGLRERNVPALDSREALRIVAGPDTAFFRTDTHWTPHGAEHVAQALAASGLVTRGDTTFTVSTGEPKEFTGDLVSFVTTKDLAPIVGLPPEKATPYTATAASAGDETDIFGGTEAGATLLIGTSYSANPTWSFAEALKLALHRDVLNLAVEGQGPARPMLDYLGSDQFSDAPPDLVIWEFPVRYLTDPSIWGAQGPVKSGA